MRRADRIAVLSAGAVVEVGTHDELMAAPPAPPGEGAGRVTYRQLAAGGLTGGHWSE